MPLSKAALMCLETSPFLIDQFFLESQERRERRNTFTKTKKPRSRFTKKIKQINPAIFAARLEQLKKDPEAFFETLHVTVNTFEYILFYIKDSLVTVGTRYRAPEEKLYMTLMYLAGVSLRTVAAASYIPCKKALRSIIATLEVIWKSLSQQYLRDPTHAEIDTLTKEFFDIWHFPNCIGAIGGKYIHIANPSLVIKQKVIMNAIVDAKQRFLSIHIIRNKFFERKNCKLLKISGMQCLPGTDIKLPLLVIGNEAYPLWINLIKPYPKRSPKGSGKEIFNKKLREARLTVDYAFKILSVKWKVFDKPLKMSLNQAKVVVKAACLLHNLIKQRFEDEDHHFANFSQGNISYLNMLVSKSRKSRASSLAMTIRDQLKYYICEYCS